MNTDEKWAWLRFGMTASAFAYLCWKLFLVDSPLEVTAWEEVRDNLGNIILVFVFAAIVLIRPGKGVVADERDRAISLLAARTAMVALSLIVLVSATIIGMDGYADLTKTRSGRWFEHYLMACLALAWVIESAVCVFHHWRDRR